LSANKENVSKKGGKRVTFGRKSSRRISKQKIEEGGGRGFTLTVVVSSEGLYWREKEKKKKKKKNWK